jgi:hypothetical protein
MMGEPGQAHLASMERGLLADEHSVHLSSADDLPSKRRAMINN